YQLARFADVVPPQVLQSNAASKNRNAMTISKRKSALIVLVALLICCATSRVLAQVAGTQEAANTGSTQARNEKASPRNIRELKPGQVVEGKLKRGETVSFN